jgi:uncharacterized OB-fold protein
MNPTNPAAYWRLNKTWQKWLGKRGTVIVATTIRVPAEEQSAFAPYDFVLIDFGKVKHSFMGVGHESFQPGDQVRCVLRKLAQPSSAAIIPYGIKVTKDLCQV